MTRYVPAFTWTKSIDRFLVEKITETPLLNVCSGRSRWGAITLDRYEPADVRAAWLALPFAANSFANCAN